MEERFPWMIIDKYFNDNPNYLVSHHLDSYNSFFNEGIKRIFKEKNPIKLMKEQDPKTGEFALRCDMYLGGKEGDKLYYGKPVIYDEGREHFMYPNEARLRNMTYGITIHYDVEVEFFIKNKDTQETEQKTIVLSKIFLGRFPIMLQSDLCILNSLDKQVRFRMGECKNDKGGYFIIDGKEKCIIPQEKFADNMLYVRAMKENSTQLYSHSAEIRSVSEDASKPVRTLSIKIVAPSTTLTNGQLVVIVPNVRKPVPLFILMRALGIESDRDIIDYCLLDRDANSHYVDLFIPSVHDAGLVFNQEVALKYIATLTKGKTIPHALEILTNYLLPHIGEMNFQDKAYFIGYMVKQVLQVFTKEAKATDRDNFRFKRIELTGSLLYDLFKEYYSLQQHNIYQRFDKEYYYKKGRYLNNFTDLIELNYKEFFSERMVADGFRKAFKGNWGAEAHTKRVGVVQDVNRLSFNSFVAQMRKLNLPLDASAKIIGPRLAHTTQWGIIDPIDTPDGGNVGLHKNLTIMATITKGYSAYPMMHWLRMNADMLLLTECTPLIIAKLCKVLVNGRWVGVLAEPRKIEMLIKTLRRVAIIPTFTSVYWSIKDNTLFIYTDAGRICRPIFHLGGSAPYNPRGEQTNPSGGKGSSKGRGNGKGEEQGEEALAGLRELAERMGLDKRGAEGLVGVPPWTDLITGFAKKKDLNFNIRADKLYDTVADLYNVTDLKELSASQAVLEYLDTAETEGALIAMDYDTAQRGEKPYTHVEIHPSLMLGIMGNQVIFPENNQLPRDLFACGQARQAISLYHSNYPVRVDKTGIVLNNGQIPLVKSRYLKYINNEEHPCGENTIVAIMSFNGYNVEDSILFNEGSLKRGLFRTTYFSVYESKEESSTVGQKSTDSFFTNIENKNVVGLKPGCDYSKLDEFGLVKENTYVDEKMVMIGKVVPSFEKADTFVDASSFPKKGQKGYVDKAFMTEGDQGFRIAKVRIRNERIPNIGDKFCSRCGQKGTVGLVIPEEDMPFTADGIKPDIIINPHAIPSRMTIGQLVESIMGKACTMQGAFGDCTAFVNKGDMAKTFGALLTANGYHSSGNDILYNGQTGEQIQSEIFMGPTYYMRLKHMVKDKINYRALGPRTVLTRQTVQGRANDGGLRIGEMERDGLIAHGITGFLQESMLVRGDDYYMAICNKTGTVAIYNESQNLFLSPMADGPIKFSGALGENPKIETLSKYGRSFSIVRVPYAFKLLMQELATMNVQMRLITEANIDQMTNMSFSDNIQRLTGKGQGQGQIDLKNVMPKQQTQRQRQGKKDLNALGFTKLPPPPFKKWLIPQIDPLKVEEDLMPIPTGGSSEIVALEAAQENSWFALKDQINEAKAKLDEIPDSMFYTITNSLDMYATLRTLVQKTYNMEHATNAALKMYEMINQFELLMTGNNCMPSVDVFCNAELPGAFIIAINHFMRTKCISSEFDWLGNSYLPEDALKAGDSTILDDKYKIYEKNRLHWLMGPAPNALPEGEEPITGDVTDPMVINALGNAAHRRFALNDGAHLYTSDVGIEIQSADLPRQEELTSFLNYGQIVSGLLSLALGGTLITKQFTFYTPFSRSLIALVASLFDETYICKPKTSRPTNSEVYLVGKGFKGISPELAKALLDRAEAYRTLDKLPTTWGSLLKPDILSKVDAEILLAGQEVHGEQQVAFVNEVAEAYRVLVGRPDMNVLTKIYEKAAQAEWLKENPLMVIQRDENLNNAVVSMEAQQAPAPITTQRRVANPITFVPAMAQTQAQAAVAPAGELVEESILIPEEEEGVNKEDNESEGDKAEAKNSKKTIIFNKK
jgi:DNA-directed RNA polymerase II subunit RPB2